MITGEPYPSSADITEADRELVNTMSHRLESLYWAAEKRPDVFAPALFTFSKRRQIQTQSLHHLLPEEGWGVLAHVPAIDYLRTGLGLGWNPMIAPSSWAGHLVNSVDEVVDCLWLLRVGLTVPAALQARILLERWTFNLASSLGQVIPTGGLDEAYISYTWQRYAPLGVSSHIGSWWGTLSELAHGRATAGRLGNAIVGQLEFDPADNIEIHKGISLTLDLCLKQIRGGLVSIVNDAGQTQYIKALQAETPRWSPGGEPFNLAVAYSDLDYYAAYSSESLPWTQLSEIYRTNLHDGTREITSRHDLVLSMEALIERRGRAIEKSRGAFSREKRELGEEFDPGYLAARLFRYTSFCELARLLGQKEDDPHERLALFTAAQALEGAVHLWLDDSDIALACLRVILEQTARLRVHRKKPNRASAMESRGDASASRWLQEAGWKRLSVLLRAINEFAHLGQSTRRPGAREALLLIQINNPREDTSRGSALDSIAHLFAFELYSRLQSLNRPASECFADTVILLDEATHLKVLEKYLNNAYEQRSHEFGPSGFTI